MSAVLQATGLTKSFDGFMAVNDVTFALAEGELLALIGPNGAGKSTCFNMLMGQLKPTKGTVTLAGETITGLSPRAIWRRGVGRTFQITAAYKSMTVIENVLLALELAGERDRSRAMGALHGLGLEGLEERYPHELSGGEQQRVAVARALVKSPALVLADEATGNLDPAAKTAIVDILFARAEEAEATLRDVNPFGRMIEPDEVAAAALWLCGPGSGAVTAQSIPISGGQV